jgi:hypothetical protein
MRMADRRYALREQVVAELPGLLSEHLRAPEQIDQVFASLARHLG